MIIYFIKANLLLAVVFLFIRMTSYVGQNLLQGLEYGWLLRLSRVLLVAALVVPLLPAFGPKPVFFAPSAQVALSTSPISSRLGTPTQASLAPTRHYEPPKFLILILAAIAGGIVFSGIVIGRSYRQLKRYIESSYPLKRFGKVEVRLTSLSIVPFSFRTPKKAYLILPSYLLVNSKNYLLAIRHEIQHHRQRDTTWVYGYEILKVLFFINPFFHLLLKSLSQIQELACDETLLFRKSVSARAYSSCLLQVVETVRDAHAPILVGTTRMALGFSDSFLKRRINLMLLNPSKRYLSSCFKSLAIGLGALALASTAWASQNIQDRKIDREEIAKLVKELSSGSSFPMDLNEQVYAELQHYVGTAEGRQFIKKTLARMKEFRPMIEEKITAYRLPIELLVIPIMESGYQNLPQSRNALHSAGIWQFVPQTARNYGLQVTEKVDERLTPLLETDAACRYLGSLFYRFQDWKLALLAYNAGENKVQEGINSIKSKNAWTLIEKGYSGDKRYLAKMIAASVILSKPSLVD